MAKQTKHNQQNLVKSLCEISNVAYMEKVDEAQWLVEFVEGQLKSDEACFLKTDSGDEFVVLPQQALHNILGNLQRNHEERLQILLQHEIRNLMPIDLEDTMAVANYELEKHRQEDGNLPSINVKELANQIRTNHPNLFLQVENIFR